MTEVTLFLNQVCIHAPGFLKSLSVDAGVHMCLSPTEILITTKTASCFIKHLPLTLSMGVALLSTEFLLR